MARNLDDVESDAMDLSQQERALLVEHLLATLDPIEHVEAEDPWLREAENRYREYRAGRAPSKPSEQVFEDASKRLE